MTINYVDNTEFLELLNNYIQDRDQRKLEGRPPPVIPNEIGKIFIQIANRLSSRYNFNGYTFKDEMISDGILNAVEAINSFDPEKSSNPFAYFTQIIFWAFVRRIEKEKKERKIRDKLMFDDDNVTFSTQDGEQFDISCDEIYLWYNKN
jgi:hypothetical protein